MTKKEILDVRLKYLILKVESTETLNKDDSVAYMLKTIKTDLNSLRELNKTDFKEIYAKKLNN